MADHISISSGSDISNAASAREPGEISASNSGSGDGTHAGDADAEPLSASTATRDNSPSPSRSEYPLADVTFAKRDRRMIKALMEKDGISAEEARRRHCQRHINDMHSAKTKKFQIRFGRKWTRREAELKQTAEGFVVTALPKPPTRTAQRRQQPEPGEVVDLVSDDDRAHHRDDEDAKSASEDEDVDDFPAQTDADYGALARNAAIGSNIRLQNARRNGDLDDADRELQARYFMATDPGALFYCLSCGQPGHMQPACPSNICERCGSHRHFSRACPNHRKCERCRQRGHPSATCRNRFVEGGGYDDPCDICGQRGHVEEECTGLWRSFKADERNTHKIERDSMNVACYNCGSSTHWGDDCPTLPTYLAQRGKGLWTAREAEKYILDGRPAIGERENGYERQGYGRRYDDAAYGDQYGNEYGGGERGSYGAYQSYQFDDMRD